MTSALHRAVLPNYPKPMTLSCFRTSITCRCGYSTATLTHYDRVNELHNHRVAVGAEGSGTRSLVEPVFALNYLTTEDMTMLPLGNHAALRALKSGEVDAAVFVDGASPSRS